ncbi:hypothetical protein CK203_054974 [Vitis vinifera]|uniref:Uncharacterized protein n=1 Tax=Vitis vinifera TaxID=29760 RepID=A0A438GNE0_VITVI|nr:hypothetical protein CK203_054974 [Vitis vinifera]
MADSSPSDVKGKKPFIDRDRQRLAHQFIQSEASQTPSTDPTVSKPHSSYASHQTGHGTSTRGLLHSHRAAMLRCSVHRENLRRLIPDLGAQQTSAPLLRGRRDSFTDSHAVEPGSRKLIETGLLTALTPRPLPQPIPAQFRMDLHYQGLVHLGQPSVTTNPLPTHTTHAVPPPAGGIHFLDFDETDDHVHMLSWDDPDPEPIMPAGFTRRRSAPYILIPDVEEFELHMFDISQTPDVQYILRGGRVVRQPPPAAARPVEGTSASQEEVRAEDDEILRQLQSTQARISIWSLLASSSTHRDALTRALSQIRVDTTTTPRDSFI